MHTHLTRAAAALLAAFALVLASVSPALAAPPTNDTIEGATEITSLPFDPPPLDTSEATATDDPYPDGYSPPIGTVWYRYAAAQTQRLTVSTEGSDYPTYIVAFSGEPGALTTVGVNLQPLIFPVTAGATYYLMVSVAYGDYWPQRTLSVHVSALPTPPNDAFADAQAIGAPPSTVTVSTTGATTEPGEPLPCEPASLGTRTVWYSYTPQASQSLTLRSDMYYYASSMAVYTGASLGGLTEVGHSCDRAFPLVFAAQAGTNYYIQAIDPYGAPYDGSLTLELTPPPVADFFYSPGDPSTFDTVFFNANAYDPAGLGVASQTWTWPDGTTSTDAWVTKQFTADGDYTVSLAVTTTDGRSATTSKTVQVRTRDVVITKFSVPQAARSGQTRQIAVGVRSDRYPQVVSVTLYRLDPSGQAFIGTLQQSVPLRPSNRTTDFSFSYTFTSQDASVGKVTFKAVATIVDGRDALPGDNEAISLPTKVGR